jgi:hypothetical protein
MRFLFVGGSNTLLAGGYVESTVSALDGFEEIAVDEVLNLSIGSTTSVKGLEIVKSFDRLPEFDLVLLEYAVNDRAFVVRKAFSMWAAAYEGLIRHIAERAPDARIVSIVLGPRRPSRKAGQQARRRRLTALCRRYGAEMIDVDAELRAAYAADPEGFDALYEDDLHYRRPDSAAVVGRMVAERLREMLRAPARTRSPRPSCPFHFTNARTIDFRAGVAPDDPRRVRFENSRFSFEAVRLPLGESLEVELSGPLLSVSYVSTPDACSLLIEENGVRSVVHTAIRGPSRPTRKLRAYRFLLHNTPATWTKWSRLTPREPRRIKLTAVTGGPDDLKDAAERRIPAKFPMAPGALAPAVNLTTLLCDAPTEAQRLLPRMLARLGAPFTKRPG